MNRLSGFSLGLIVAIFSFSNVHGQDLDPVAVKQTIEGGIAYLQERQLPGGGWKEYSAEENCGATALVVLALVASGVPKNDPMVEKAMNYLRQFGPENVKRTYSMSLLTMAFCLVDPDRDALRIRSNVDWLARKQVKDPNNVMRGGWHYQSNMTSDNSNAQFAILALYEAERVGISVDIEVWKLARDYWERAQNSNGSWGYIPQDGGGSGGGTGSMTTAGIASLVITSGVLAKGGAKVEGGNVLCCQNIDDATQEHIRKGLEWMGQEFRADANPNSPTYLYYYYYGLERVGRLTANRFIGEHDWYRSVTDALLKQKGELANNWDGHSTSDIVSTAFALIFLSKGRRPILVSKIEYGADDSWNAHPNDINNLAAYVEKQWTMDLTWQVVSIQKASVDDLLQSPVIFICGNKSPLPIDKNEADKLVEKLRGYLDRGGFIFAEAYGDDESFDRGFRELMRKVLPEDGYELHLLEPDHAIWRMEKEIAPAHVRPLEGIDFGCQTSVVYAPPFNYGTEPGKPISIKSFRPSLSCLWELARPIERGEKYPDAVRQQIDNGLGIGVNVLAYATKRELKKKGDEPLHPQQIQSGNPSERGKIHLGLLSHGGGSNCAPRAVPRLMGYVGSKKGMRVNTSVEKVPLNEKVLLDYPILFMHGRTAFRFSAEEREILRKYIERGGFLFVNSICASKTFTESFRSEMKQTFPNAELKDIEPNDPILSDIYQGEKIDKLQIRKPQRSGRGRLETVIRDTPPKLQGITLDGKRWVIVFSPYDVSCALEKTNSIECEGYTYESALKIGMNVLLYALEHR